MLFREYEILKMFSGERDEILIVFLNTQIQATYYIQALGLIQETVKLEG
jgi:hypothetical protein